MSYPTDRELLDEAMLFIKYQQEQLNQMTATAVRLGAYCSSQGKDNAGYFFAECHLELAVNITDMFLKSAPYEWTPEASEARLRAEIIAHRNRSPY